MSDRPPLATGSSPRSSGGVAWTSWPARERPGAAVAGLAAVGLFGLAGGLFGGHWLVGVASAAMLLGFLQRFFFPVRCRVDRDVASVRTLLGSRTMPTASIRRVAHDGKAILLSSRSAPSSADALRGLILPLPADGAERVLESVRPLVGGSEGVRRP